MFDSAQTRAIAGCSNNSWLPVSGVFRVSEPPPNPTYPFFKRETDMKYALVLLR